jgi:hypothetical protein
MSGMDRNAFAVEAILKACSERGVILVDKRNPKGKAKADDRLEVIGEISPTDPDEAA